MGYQGQGPLRNNGHALFEPLSHTNCRPSKDTIGLGYGAQEDLLECSNNSRSAIDSNLDIDQSLIHSRTPAAMVDDFIPSTSLLWSEEPTTSDNEAPMPTPQDPHESTFRDRQ